MTDNQIMSERFDALVKYLMQRGFSFLSSVDRSGFGDIRLSIHYEDHLFVFEFRPPDLYGVDEILDGEGFIPGYKHVYNSFDEAAKQLETFLIKCSI